MPVNTFVDMTNPLLQVFMDRLKTELVDAMLAAVRPQAVAFAESIVKEMQPAVEKQYDLMRDRTLFMFQVKEPTDAPGSR